MIVFGSGRAAKSLTFLGSSLALGLVSAPITSATTASYLDALQVLGVHWWEGDGGREKAVAAGLKICHDLRAGRSQDAVVDDLVVGDGSIAWKPSEIPVITADARNIVGAATVHLCPDAP
jgi:Protein of unknown function (DUF732)